MRVATPLIGYAWASNAPLDMTTDGGRTWTLLALDRVVSLETTGGVVWALAGEQPYPTIWRAPVGTDSWTAITLTPDRSATLDVRGTTAYVTGQQGAGPIAGSIDIVDATATARTVHNEPTPCQAAHRYTPWNPLGISTDGSLVMVCVAQDPAGKGNDLRSAYVSTDRGRTWSTISAPPEDPTDVTATRHAVLAWGQNLDRYAAGHWTTVLAGPTSGKGFLLVGFQDDAHGIAIDATGRVSITRDGGRTWTVARP